MSVKVLKPGVIPPDDLYEVKCPNCGCLFECGPLDFHSADNGALKWFGREEWKEIACPTCHVQLKKELNARPLLLGGLKVNRPTTV